MSRKTKFEFRALEIETGNICQPGRIKLKYHEAEAYGLYETSPSVRHTLGSSDQVKNYPIRTVRGSGWPKLNAPKQPTATEPLRVI